MEDKKMVAAIAAVTAYIQSEEEAIAMQVAAAPDAARREPAPAGVANLWGISGRQAVMQLRTMMQLKSFHRMPPR